MILFSFPYLGVISFGLFISLLYLLIFLICIGCSVFYLNKQTHRWKQFLFQFPVFARFPFTPWDHSWYMCPGAVIPWGHSHENLTLCIPVTEQPLEQQCITSVTTWFLPSSFLERERLMYKWWTALNCPQKPPSGHRRMAAKFPV